MPKQTVQYSLADAVAAIRSDDEKVVLLDRSEHGCALLRKIQRETMHENQTHSLCGLAVPSHAPARPKSEIADCRVQMGGNWRQRSDGARHSASNQ